MISDLPLDADLEKLKTSKITLAEMLGDMIWEDLSECLIKDCLVYSIPTNSSKLQQYEEVRAEVSPEVWIDHRFLSVSFVYLGDSLLFKKIIHKMWMQIPYNFISLLACYLLIGKYAFSFSINMFSLVRYFWKRIVFIFVSALVATRRYFTFWLLSGVSSNTKISTEVPP